MQPEVQVLHLFDGFPKQQYFAYNSNKQHHTTHSNKKQHYTTYNNNLKHHIVMLIIATQYVNPASLC